MGSLCTILTRKRRSTVCTLMLLAVAIIMASGGSAAPARAGAAAGARGPCGCKVMAGGGGAAGPAQSIRHQAPGARTRCASGSSSVIMYIYIHYNTAHIPASRSVSCNVGVITARSMQKITGPRPVCTSFEHIQNGLYAYVLVRTGLYQYVLS